MRIPISVLNHDEEDISKDSTRKWSYCRDGNIRPELIKTDYRVFAGSRPCQSSFFFIGDNRSFRKSNETFIPAGDLSSAYCEVRFLAKHVEGQLWWDQKGFSQFGQSQISRQLKFVSKRGPDLKPAPGVSQWVRFSNYSG